MTNDKNDDARIGAGHAEAMFRMGLKELRGALYPDSNVAQPGEYGLYGTRTPGEVAESRRSDGLGLEEEKGSLLTERIRAAETQPALDEKARDLEVER